MLPSIPASRIVKISPQAIGTGGEALALNTVAATKNGVFSSQEFASFADVGAVFGLTSDEYKFAEVYFNGFEGSNIKPDALYICKFNKSDTTAALIGGSVKSLKLEDLKKITGKVTLSIDGKQTMGNIDLSASKSFSDAANIMSTALKASVIFDEKLQRFIVKSGTVGATSVISFASGVAATALMLSKEMGAIVNNDTTADTALTFMNKVTNYTLNFAVITLITDTFTLENWKDLASWNTKQDSRYWLVKWGLELPALNANNSSCFGGWIEENAIEGTTALYGTLEQAALACGYAASIDFAEFNGRATMEFKRQSGIPATVTNTADASALESNGYAYYGAWATANERFIFFRNTKVSGKFKWVDNYLTQVYFNAQLQLAFVNMLINYKSIPYNTQGVAIHRAVAQDPINEMLNFGGIRAGVVLSSQQKSLIDTSTGRSESWRDLTTQGYLVMIEQATPQNRGLRQSLPMKIWYTDGGSVHSVNIASINVQ